MATKEHKPKPAAPAVRDSDHDGMPDKWETANGLNHAATTHAPTVTVTD
jgi:hypothetical protein